MNCSVCIVFPVLFQLSKACSVICKDNDNTALSSFCFNGFDFYVHYSFTTQHKLWSVYYILDNNVLDGWNISVNYSDKELEASEISL